MENSKYFYIWIGLSALLIAGSAAAFSVYGLAKLFSGAFLSVVVMAGALELGKLVTASFLYRYWNVINYFQKVYMTIATLVLIFITSAGIFGYLSNAYQGATLEFEKQSTELLTIEERIEQLEEDKVFLKEELEVAISELPDNYITAKRKLREDYNPQILEINNELLEYKRTRADLEIGLVSTGVDVGPAIYLARTFGTDIDTVVKFFIFILIFVFDPLAVMLVIAYNQALMDRQKNLQVDASATTPPTFIEDNDRMDIIGQNGNDGLHYDVSDQDLIDDDDFEIEEEIINEPEVEPREENDPRLPVNKAKVLPPTAKGGVRF